MKKIIFSFCLVSILALGLMIVRNSDENYAPVDNVNIGFESN